MYNIAHNDKAESYLKSWESSIFHLFYGLTYFCELIWFKKIIKIVNDFVHFLINAISTFQIKN